MNIYSIPSCKAFIGVSHKYILFLEVLHKSLDNRCVKNGLY
jgi:hypothetical protein